MREKIFNGLGFILFIVFFILMFPFNFLIGGLIRNKRYFHYILDEVNEKPHKQYYF